MIGSNYFDNQIIKPVNLEFQRDSTQKNIKENLLAFSKQSGGIVSGLVLTSGAGTDLNISAGCAYDNTGERMEAYSGVTITAPSGSNLIWATMVESDFNPDPTSPPPYPSFPEYGQAQSNINPVTGSGVNVSTFNTLVVSTTSGTGSIPLGLVTISGGSFIEINSEEPYRQNLKLVGVLDVNTSSIDGTVIELGTIDSNRFVNPLGYDIYLDSGISIYPTFSGTSNLGTQGIPFLEIDVKNLNVTNISGLSPINIKSDVVMSGLGLYTKYINSDGEDLYVGGYYGGPSQGTLKTNKISSWESGPVPAPLNITAGVSSNGGIITIDGGGYDSTEKGVVINGQGDGLSLYGAGTVDINGYTGFNISGTSGTGKIYSNDVDLSAKNNLIIQSTEGTILATAAYTLINSPVDIMGNLNVRSGLSTIQSFDNLLPNSEFRHLASGNSGLPAGWYTDITGTGDIFFNNHILTNTDDVKTTDSDSYIEVSGSVNVSPANSVGFRTYFTPKDSETYSLSYYYRTTNSDFFIRNALGNISNTLTPTADGDWHLYQQNFTPGSASLFAIQIESSTGGTALYDFDICNIKLTKGRGVVNANKNNTSAFSYTQSADFTHTSTGSSGYTYLDGIPQININSAGQFVMINFSSTFECDLRTNIQNNGSGRGNLKLDIDGSTVCQSRQFLQTQLDFGTVAGKGSNSALVNWAGFLSPGNHTIDLGAELYLSNGGNSVSFEDGVLSILLI